MKKIIMAILVLLLLFSCSMKQEIYLEKDGSGTADVEISLRHFVLTTITDLAEVSPDVDPDELLDPDKIAESMMKNPEITNVSAARPLKNKLNMSFDFGSIDRLFNQTENDVQNSGLFLIENLGDETKLTFRINKDTYKGFSKVIPNIDDPTMAALAPDPDIDISEAEYLDMIEFFFGDDGPEGVMDSMLDLIINVNGTIINQTGGTRLNDSKVEFNIPLIRILLLDQELVYSITYK